MLVLHTIFLSIISGVLWMAFFYVIGSLGLKVIEAVIVVVVRTWPWGLLVPAAFIAWWIFPQLPEWASAISQASYQLGIAGWIMGIILVGGWTWFSWVAFSASRRSQRSPQVARHSPVSRRPTAQRRRAAATCQSSV